MININVEQAFCDKNYCHGSKYKKMLCAGDYLSISSLIYDIKFIIKKIDNDK